MVVWSGPTGALNGWARQRQSSKKASFTMDEAATKMDDATMAAEEPPLTNAGPTPRLVITKMVRGGQEQRNPSMTERMNQSISNIHSPPPLGTRELQELRWNPNDRSLP